MDLKTQVKRQIELIEDGKPLEAFKKFFSDKVIMNNNDVVFAKSKKEGIELQSEFFKNISEFKTKVYYSNLVNEISTIAINYSFINIDKKSVNFKGIHRQKWEDGFIITEDFYTGEYLNLPEFEAIDISEE